ncbi:MAG TPA: GPP34 family phosphoprotein [Kiritimatiellia bacterium]|nr:GPP34 family phosphoprotein [Kiritimatiellia bacterium]HRZ11356.1 GPP34 family phosphoprotein [Kiritimatiellia bacterium]HSA17093.1 GPP34 family phosphoprotein [Kiritimatiellia bacterium]
MLTFAEEIVLLALDEKEGVITELPHQALHAAMSGAVLMELCLLNRVDVDAKQMKVVDTTPTGEPILDAVLKDLQGSHPEHTLAYWLNRMAGHHAHEILRLSFTGLVRKGVLREEKHRFLWVFPDRRYPRLNDREFIEVRARLRQALLGTDIPEVRDIVLVSLLNACRLIPRILADDELPRAHARIAQLSRLDLIGQALAQSIREIEFALSLPMML